MSILDIRKIGMYEDSYDQLKSKYQIKAKLCYIDKDSFKFHIKTEDVYKDFSNDVKDRCDTPFIVKIMIGHWLQDRMRK